MEKERDRVKTGQRLLDLNNFHSNFSKIFQYKSIWRNVSDENHKTEINRKWRRILLKKTIYELKQAIKMLRISLSKDSSFRKINWWLIDNENMLIVVIYISIHIYPKTSRFEGQWKSLVTTGHLKRTETEKVSEWENSLFVFWNEGIERDLSWKLTSVSIQRVIKFLLRLIIYTISIIVTK